jgi:signal peptidase II
MVQVLAGPRLRVVHFGIAAVVLLLDQMTKWLIVKWLPLYTVIVVIPHVFSITHVFNRGAAFSMFDKGASRATTLALVFFSLVVIVVLLRILWRSIEGTNAMTFALSLILGGAIGNLVDRVRTGSVVDFLSFSIGRYHWPDFNLADSAIVIGSMLLIIDVLRSSRQAALPSS